MRRNLTMGVTRTPARHQGSRSIQTESHEVSDWLSGTLPDMGQHVRVVITSTICVYSCTLRTDNEYSLRTNTCT